MTVIVALIAGLIFGLGLTVSRMVDPAKVLGFLDVAGTWDPSLPLVMVGGIVVAFPAFHWVRRRGHNVLGRSVIAPPPWAIDARLIAGAAVFGVGWGLVGLCPGPALAALGLGSGRMLIFVAAMLGGMVAMDQLNRYLATRRTAASAPSEV
jgi:uncharacterized membrane protein YedE/YeeE